MTVWAPPLVVDPLGHGMHSLKSRDMKYPSLHLHCETLTDPMLVVLALAGQAWQPLLLLKEPKAHTQAEGSLDAMFLVVRMAGQLVQADSPFASENKPRGQYVHP
mmetsp:Transcript_59931/g.175162  ORF Transcript_59931/g.175162 Transcript_59931/m.175162 type:complete len:105 (-) Transcript_59931:205-519(-)